MLRRSDAAAAPFRSVDIASARLLPSNAHRPDRDGLPALIQHAEEIISTLERIRSESGEGEVMFHHSLPTRSIQVIPRDAEGYELDANGDRLAQ